jgi:hypothetical protein
MNILFGIELICYARCQFCTKNPQRGRYRVTQPGDPQPSGCHYRWFESVVTHLCTAVTFGLGIFPVASHFSGRFRTMHVAFRIIRQIQTLWRKMVLEFCKKLDTKTKTVMFGQYSFWMKLLKQFRHRLFRENIFFLHVYICFVMTLKVIRPSLLGQIIWAKFCTEGKKEYKLFGSEAMRHCYL